MTLSVLNFEKITLAAVSEETLEGQRGMQADHLCSYLLARDNGDLKQGDCNADVEELWGYITIFEYRIRIV